MPSLNELFYPDGKSLTVQVIGKPGSGKSFWLKNMIRAFMNQCDDPDFRLIFVCPKQEMLFDWLPDKKKQKPIGVDKLENYLRYNRIAVVYLDPEYIEAEADYAIDLLFAIKRANPDFKATIFVDDSQVFISSRRAASQSFKTLALTGRSKGIRFVAVSHSVVYSKDLEGAVSYLVMFSLPLKLFHRDAKARYGFDPEPYMEKMREKEYSYVIFDVTKATSQLMNPLEV